jgi:hypothetical protein
LVQPRLPVAGEKSELPQGRFGSILAPNATIRGSPACKKSFFLRDNADFFLAQERLVFAWNSITEGGYQHGTPQDTNRGNFVPKCDLTRYCNAIGDYSCNGTTVCRAVSRPISHHFV